MFPERLMIRSIPNEWIRWNVRYALVGLLIGAFVNILFRVIGAYRMDWKDGIMTFVVSLIITLCTTNIHLISGRIIKVKFKSPVVNVLLNYGLIFMGVIIGTEVSIGCISLLYDIPFGEIDQVKNLQRNLGIGFLVGTVLYIYQLQRDNYNLKISEKELQVARLNELKTAADLKTLQARINPHFLYNALNSITSLIHDAPDRAEEMTIKLSQLFRYSINTQDANWSTVADELEIVNIYLDIERVRFGDRITFETVAGPEVMEYPIPRFLLQPLVENALKHGLKNKSGGGILSIRIYKQDEYLVIEVHDNGESFPADMLAGYGLQSTAEKLQLLYGNSGSLNYMNKPEKKISIKLPLRQPT